jgi:hypothetical protein
MDPLDESIVTEIRSPMPDHCFFLPPDVEAASPKAIASKQEHHGQAVVAAIAFLCDGCTDVCSKSIPNELELRRVTVPTRVRGLECPGHDEWRMANGGGACEGLMASLDP